MTDNECQICNADLGTAESYAAFSKRFEDAHTYTLNPTRLRCCSDTCMERAIMGSAIHRLRQSLKDLEAMPLESFAEVFKFDLAGGYAAEKHERFRQSQTAFLHSLSKDKLILLARWI